MDASGVRKSEFEIDNANKISWAGELSRKATHLGALVVPGLYLWFDLTKAQALAILIPATTVALTIDVSRLKGGKLWSLLARFLGFMIRKHEDHGDFMGSSYILVAMCLTILFFSPTIAAVALAFIIVGDTFAAIVGRKWGRIHFKDKTLEGSLACFVSTAGVAYVASLHLGLPLAIGIVGAVVATLVEAAPDFIDDNLSVPLVSGLVMHLGLAIAS